MAYWKAYLRDKLEEMHPCSELAIKDVKLALEHFASLKPSVKNYVHPVDGSKELFGLEGTIPVVYRGATYNIPIRIWLPNRYPYVPPMVYVVPTSEMEIKMGKHVDISGRVYLPYLTEWKHPQSDLFGLIQVLSLIFGEQPPVFAVRRNYTVPKPDAGRNPPGSNPKNPTSLDASPQPPAPGTQDNIRNLNDDLIPAQYLYAGSVINDARIALDKYEGLSPAVKNYVYPDGSEKDLVCLEGTIPIVYRGTAYNIPIIIWLEDRYPCNPPMVYVVPTAEMKIKSGEHVDNSGRIYLPFLSDWKHPQFDLIGLIQVLCVKFSEQPPMFAGSRSTPTVASERLVQKTVP